MASFLWYNQSRYYGPLIELTSFREKSFFRVTFDTQTINGYTKIKLLEIESTYCLVRKLCLKFYTKFF